MCCSDETKEKFQTLWHFEEKLSLLRHDIAVLKNKNITIPHENLITYLDNLYLDYEKVKDLFMPSGHGKNCNCGCFCGVTPCACDRGCEYWSCC